MRAICTLTATVGILLALAGPTLAASRNQNAADAYGSRSGAYNYGPVTAEGRNANAQALTPAQQQYQPQYNRGQNLPYPDRPYGAPDSW